MEQQLHAKTHGFNDPFYQALFSLQTFNYISGEITQRLFAKYPQKKPIRVTHDNINAIMWQWYDQNSTTPEVMIEEVINVFVNDISNQLDIEDQNHALDPWIQVLDENSGISRYDSNIKLNHRRYQNVDFEVRR